MKKPLGGTELQEALLEKYVDPKLLEDFQITTSVPEKIPLSTNKINVLWLQNSYDQPNLIDWFKNKDNHKKYFFYVFNSNWLYEKFRYHFDIPTEKCTVIKNAVEPIVKKAWDTEKKPVRMIFHPTRPTPVTPV